MEEVQPPVDRDRALEIAREDAGAIFRDLSPYEARVERAEDGGWAVEFELRDKSLNGGGMHYVVSAETGEITRRLFSQ